MFLRVLKVFILFFIVLSSTLFFLYWKDLFSLRVWRKTLPSPHRKSCNVHTSVQTDVFGWKKHRSTFIIFFVLPPSVWMKLKYKWVRMEASRQQMDEGRGLTAGAEEEHSSRVFNWLDVCETHRSIFSNRPAAPDGINSRALIFYFRSMFERWEDGGLSAGRGCRFDWQALWQSSSSSEQEVLRRATEQRRPFWQLSLGRLSLGLVAPQTSSPPFCAGGLSNPPP